MKSQYKKRVTKCELRNTKKPKVFVGLSGGVDSAVSTALLQRDGFDVTGVFIKAWTPEGYPCSWKEDRRSAMRVSAVLDIPFITLDLEKEYKKEVVDYMIAEYKKGRTPNPDVMCNKEIKFGHFLKFALEQGADFVATGHYARKREIPNSKFQITNKFKIQNNEYKNRYHLLEGKDKNKDQSYFLWTLTQAELKHTLFPVGHLEKSEVRKLAGKFGLPQETRKDSQGLCFLGKIDMKEFLKNYIKSKKGDVINKKGEVIGYHNGALFYTIGERRGFVVTKNTNENNPLYVVAKDIVKNTITVESKIDLDKYKGNKKILPKEVVITRINWTLGEEPDFTKRYVCRIRYRQEKIGCKLVQTKKGKNKIIKVVFDKPQMGVSLGQSLVVYDGDLCLGGGVMEIKN